MVSDVTGVAAQAVTLRPQTQNTDLQPAGQAQPVSPIGVPAADAGSKNGRANAGTTDPSLGRFARLEAQREKQYAQAQQTLEVLSTAQATLTAMKARFEGITKQYPPYAQDNPDRVDMLNQINGLRKQIEALQFPKPDGQEAIPTLPRLGFGDIDPMKTSDRDLLPFMQQVESAQQDLAALPSRMWGSADAVNTAISETSQARAQLSQRSDVAIGASTAHLSTLV